MNTQPLRTLRRVSCAELTARAQAEGLAQLTLMAQLDSPRKALHHQRSRELCRRAGVGLAVLSVVAIYVLLVLMLAGSWR